MVRQKHTSKKQKGSVDFKKIKRKIGRKLPPPKNATDTTVKSKAIIIPEQSVASDKAGLALSNKGLTLKELLQQTSHHNAKVRKDALNGIKDLVLKFPLELQLHKVVIIEKLRERIDDDDKSVRETLYQLLKSVVFPCLKDIPGPIISLLMAYVFNAMTHLAMDIRLMAFKFFDLIVQHYPSSFYSYAEKILHNYEDILQNSQIYFQDKSKLKLALAGLGRCLSLLASDKKKVDTSCNQEATLHAFDQETSKGQTGHHSTLKKIEDLMPTLVNCFMQLAPSVRVMPVAEGQSFDCMLHTLDCINLAVRVCTPGQEEPANSGAFFPQNGPVHVPGVRRHTISLLLKKLFEIFPLNPVHNSLEKDEYRYIALNVGITEIFLYLNELIQFPMILMEKFLQFIQNFLSEQIYSNKRSNKAIFEKHLASLIPFMPKIILKVDFSWRSHLLEVFTRAFRGCKPESALTLACLSAMEEMLFPKQRQEPWILEGSSPELLDYQLAWVRELSELLLHLGDKHPLSSKAVLRLQHRLGQCNLVNSPLANEYDNMQLPLRKFYCSCTDEGRTYYGPFIKLTRDCQELAVCCLYYFSSLDSMLLESVASCCLCPDLDPDILFRIVEVVHSAYKAGHVQISDHISFLITFLAKFRVIPEQFHLYQEKAPTISNRGTYKALVNAVCSCFSQMGDGYLVLEILQKTTFRLLHLKLPLENTRAVLRLLLLLSPESRSLPEEGIGTLSYSLSGYLIGAASFLLPNNKSAENSHWLRIFQYYMQPAIILLHRSNKLLTLVLELLVSSIMESNSSSIPEGGIQSSLELLSRIHAVASLTKFIYEDVKLHQSLSSCRLIMKRILLVILNVQVSNESTINLEEKHKLQCAFDQLKTQTDRLHRWDATDFQGLSEVR